MISRKIHRARTPVGGGDPTHTGARHATHINRGAFRYYQRLRRLDRFVAQNFDRRISLQRAADVAGLERTYFSKFFHAKIGICFHDWLALVRVGEAKRLFGESDLTVTETAYRTGFHDLGTFERAFKKFTGRTPSDYRKLVRPD